MGFKARSGNELQAARQAAAARFLAIAEAIKAEAGIVHHRLTSGLHGWAFPELGIIHAPEGRTRKQLYILAHECAHVWLCHNSKKPRHVEEHEAEMWAHAVLRAHGVPVPRAMTRRAKRYVARKIHQAKRRGAKRINADAARFAASLINPNGTDIGRLAKQMLAVEKAPHDKELAQRHAAEWPLIPWSARRLVIEEAKRLESKPQPPTAKQGDS
jgi:hypothetical protein